MAYEFILFEVDEKGIATLTLNRPKSFNSFNHGMSAEMAEACRETAQRDDIKVLVITGAGKAFSSGGDIDSLAQNDDNWKKKASLDDAVNVADAMSRIEKPVIAAVNGVAAGAATAMILGCDIAIASDKARYAPNFINIASVPDSGGTYFLPRLIGPKKALELFWSGRIISAAEALELGIFNRVVPHDDLMKEVYALAEKLAAGPTKAIAFVKRLVKEGMKNDLLTQCELENYFQVMAWSTEDFVEATRAFMEKRPPQFKGR